MEDSQKNSKLSESNLEKPSNSERVEKNEDHELDENAEKLLAQAREEMQKRLSIEMARIFGQ